MTSWSPPPRPAESQTHSVLKEGGKQLSVTQLVNFVCVCVCVCVLLGRCVTVLSSLNFLVALLLKSNFSFQLCHPTLTVTEGEKEGGREGERERLRGVQRAAGQTWEICLPSSAFSCMSERHLAIIFLPVTLHTQRDYSFGELLLTILYTAERKGTSNKTDHSIIKIYFRD